jgi:hypothetical protein
MLKRISGSKSKNERPIERVKLVGAGHPRLTYVHARGYRRCGLSNEGGDWEDAARRADVHIVYVPTRWAVELGSLKSWVMEWEGYEGPVEDMVDELMCILKDPWFQLARIFIASEERHPGGWSRDVISAEWNMSSCATDTSSRFDRTVDTILARPSD